jgi:hypothetical protein
MDEVRVWKVARTAEQIRENLSKPLTGSEPGLVGLWNFDDPANPGRDASPNHHDGKLIGNARAEAMIPSLQSTRRFGKAVRRMANAVLELDGATGFVELPRHFWRAWTRSRWKAGSAGTVSPMLRAFSTLELPSGN